MTIKAPDYSLPPQRVLNIYDPNSFSPHTLVTEGPNNTYRLGEIDFHAVNLYALGIQDLAALPVKGEQRVLEGLSIRELYTELNKLGHEIVLSHREPFARKLQKTANYLTYGFSTKVVTPLILHDDYCDFVQIAEQRRASPSNIKLAYEFIKEHPMFWRITKTRTGGMNVVSGEGFSRLQFDVLPKNVVTIESGPGNYHDYNLDAYGNSFDAAVINFAELLSTHYDLHGSFTDTTKREPNDNFVKASRGK